MQHHRPLPSAGSVVIDQVETLLVDLPTIRPHKLSMAVMDGQTLMLVRIRCSDGTVGIGEGTTIGGLAYGAESPEGMKLAIDTYFAPQLIGADANRVPALMDRLHTAFRDNRFAKCAVETALFDALGHRTGLPVSELLGGRLRDRLPVAWTLASGDTGKDIAEAQRMLALRRHNIFKLKIGRRAVRDDIAHVAGVANGVVYLVGAIFAGSIVLVFSAFPPALIAALAGLALIGAIVSNFALMAQDGVAMEPAVIAFLATASGMSLFGLGAAFWGVVLGMAAHGLLRAVAPAP